MRRMLDIRVKGCFVLELHDTAKTIAFSSRRNIWAHMGLKKSGDQPLESGNLFRGPVLLSFQCSLLPLKCEYMKDARRLAFRSRHFRKIERDEGSRSDGKTAISQQRTAC